jgi:anti-anti-sigma factor
VRVARGDDVVVLDLLGALDLAAREEAAIALANVVSEAPRVIVVNLQGLSYMDSTGLHCLLRAKSLADAVGTRMAVLNGSGAPHRLLALTRMDDVIEVVDDLAQLDPPAVRSP